MRSSDQGVRVRGVTHNEHTNVISGASVDGLTLWLEDSTVGLKQVAALHAGRTRTCTDEQRDIGAIKGCAGVIKDVNAVQLRERAVIEFHGRTLGCLQRGGDFQQTQAHWNIGA